MVDFFQLILINGIKLSFMSILSHTGKRSEKRNLEKDRGAQLFLNYFPPSCINLRQPLVLSTTLFPNENSDLYKTTSGSTFQIPSISNTPTIPSLKETPDLWEVLVDRVITISESRVSRNKNRYIRILVLMYMLICICMYIYT